MMRLGILALALLGGCTTHISDENGPGEGEGVVAGEGEGEGEGGRRPAGEGEGDGVAAGEGEGSVAGEGEGSAVGEGEGSAVGEGEGEGGAATTCTSGHHWLLGDIIHTDLMEPGISCIACHAQHGNAPQYAAAGTVMEGLHDEDTCHGTSGVTVTIVDANGATFTATTNLNGNFHFDQAIAMPYHASVTQNGTTSSMVAAQATGDCMACHTQAGANGAPGRILAP